MGDYKPPHLNLGCHICKSKLLESPQRERNRRNLQGAFKQQIEWPGSGRLAASAFSRNLNFSF